MTDLSKLQSRILRNQGKALVILTKTKNYVIEKYKIETLNNKAVKIKIKSPKSVLEYMDSKADLKDIDCIEIPYSEIVSYAFPTLIKFNSEEA